MFRSPPGDGRLRLYLAIVVALAASILHLTALGSHPLFDWDEATYGRVAESTLTRGDVFTLSDLSGPWFEKPPLYIWLTMISVSFLGPSEFSVRLPSALFSVLAIILLYLLALELTGNAWLAFFASMILLFTEPFFMFGSRATRMDTAAVAAILLAVLSLTRGFKNEWWLIGIGVGIGVGVMMKSVIGLLVIVPIVVLSAVMKRWGWLRNKFFRYGMYCMLLIVVPWHAYESYLFGSAFWDVYLLDHIIDRAFRTIQTAHYFQNLWRYVEPWIGLSLALIPLIVISRAKDRITTAAFLGLLSAIILIILFTLARTKIWWYLLPVYPFIALFSAAGLFHVWEHLLRWRGKYLAIACASLLIFGAKITITNGFSSLYEQNPYLDDQKNVGLLLRQDNGNEKIVICCWNRQESIRFYSRQSLIGAVQGGSIPNEPHYFIIPTRRLAGFITANTFYETAEIVYGGQYLTLLHVAPSVISQNQATVFK